MVDSLLMNGPIFALREGSLAVASFVLLLGNRIVAMSVSFQELGDERADIGGGAGRIVAGDDDAPAGRR